MKPSADKIEASKAFMLAADAAVKALQDLAAAQNRAATVAMLERDMDAFGTLRPGFPAMPTAFEAVMEVWYDANSIAEQVKRDGAP